MLLPDHEFIKPTTLAETLATLTAADGEIKILANRKYKPPYF